MKKYLSIAFAAFIFSASVKAQGEPEGSVKLLDAYRKKSALDRLQPKQPKVTPRTIKFPNLDTPEQVQEEQTPSVVKLPLEGKYLGSNGKGDEIYAMKPDSMPCLVPNKNSGTNMPVAEYKKHQNWKPFKKNSETDSKE